MVKRQVRISKSILFVVLLLIGFICLFTDFTNKFHFLFFRIFNPVLTVGRFSATSAVANRPLPDEMVSRVEYNRLENHLENIREQLYQEHQKVQRLSGLRSRFALEKADLVLADVITISMGGLEGYQLTINRGQTDGLSPGQYVLGDNCIVGSIAQVSSYTAKVRLIIDLNHKILIKIAARSSYIKGIMQGDGAGSAKISMVARKFHIEKDDVVYASKNPGFLEVPMIIGRITECNADDSSPLLWDIKVKPGCDLEKLDNVAVIIMNPEDKPVR